MLIWMTMIINTCKTNCDEINGDDYNIIDDNGAYEESACMAGFSDEFEFLHLLGRVVA